MSDPLTGITEATEVDADDYLYGVVDGNSRRFKIGPLATALQAEFDYREVLTAERNYSVRYNLGVVTMTIATPSEVTTLVPHLLSVNDPVVFHLPFDAENGGGPAPTISIATPGVINFGGPHGYANNDPVRLRFTRTPPGGLANDTLYFARNVATNTLEVSLTSGGASIATTGAFVGYVKVERWSLLPSGGEVVEGQVYYVKTVPSSTKITFSGTPGGAAIATSGTQRGKITMQTGKDTNTGLTTAQADALLTPQKAYDLITDLDLNDKSTAIVLAESKYLSTNFPVLGCYRTTAVIDPDPSNTPFGGGKITVIGSYDRQSNVVLKALNSPTIEVYGNPEAMLRFNFMTLEGDPDTGYFTALNVIQTTNPIYADYLSFRGPYAECMGAFHGKIWIHGTVEIFGDILSDIYDASQNGYIGFADPGGGYFQGTILYGTINAGASILYASDSGKIFLSAQFNGFEGTFPCAWAWVRSGGIITSQYPYTDPAAAAWLMGEPAVYQGGTINVQYVAAGPYRSTINADYWLSRPLTVADLEAAGYAGREAYVSDATSAAYGSVVAGGGAIAVKVRDNGAQWLVVGGDNLVGADGSVVNGGIPQNSYSANTTTDITHANRHLLHPTADNNARTFTIAANGSVAYPIGTTLTFVNKINTLTIAITTDTLTNSADSATGSRTLAPNGIATALKIASTEWLISGTGLT